MKTSVNTFVTNKQSWLLLSILVIYCYATHFRHLGEVPSGMHTWTQSDHYALARGFVENDLDFFHPQTQVYHYQYPTKWDPTKQSLVTAVDFPIHNYIPAIVMKITGSESPAIYQVYMILLSIIGLLYLFRLAYLFNSSTTLSFLIVIFVASSPVFTFYQIRFIPSVPSLSTAIIGCYYAFLYQRSRKFKHFSIGFALLTLAAMTRLTFLIPLVAWLGQEFIRLWKVSEHRTKKVLVMASAVICLGGYLIYNHHLRIEYGGIFLNHAMPADSFSQFIDFSRYILKTWKFEYVTFAHYIIVVIGFFVFIYQLIKKRVTFKPTKNGWLALALFCGSSLFYIVMCTQFRAHDYYFIDVFLLPIILALCWISQKVAPALVGYQKLLIAFTIISCAAMLFLNERTQLKRHDSERWGLNTITNQNFKNSSFLLDRLQIPANEKLFVLDPVSRSVPFLFMHRTGYVIMRNHKADLKDALTIPMNYYIFQNEFFLSGIYKTYPELINRLEVIGTDGKITVCKKIPFQKNSLFDFLNLNDKKAVFESKLDTNTLASWEVSGEQTNEKATFNVSSKNEFGPVLKIRNSALFNQIRVVYFKGQIKWDQQEEIEFVTSFSEATKLTVYKVFSMKDATKRSSDWQDFQFLITLPATKESMNELSVYLWNTKKVDYQFRNVSCKLY